MIQSEVSSAAQKGLLCRTVPGIGKARLGALLRDQLFLRTEITRLHEVVPELAALRPGTQLWDTSLLFLEKQLELAKKHEAKILCCADGDFPPLLARAEGGASLIFVKGSLEALRRPAIGVIGTREPTAHGVESARRIAAEFGQKGWAILSGLAIGSDAAAHLGAVEAGVPTIGVLAHGLEKVYPKQNEKLAAEMLSTGGALVSEYAIGAQTFRSSFVERDFTQAALSVAIVVVQTGTTGGSLHACRAALKLGRTLVVVFPTKRDVAAGEEKIAGNLLLANGLDSQRTELLNCSKADLRRIVVLNSRDQYPELDQNLKAAYSDICTPSGTKGPAVPAAVDQQHFVSRNIDLVIQYAVLLAGQADTPSERLLGPIHLIKFVYLADLANAAANDGSQFTSADWTFYKFGPWSASVYQRIEPALKKIQAAELRFEGELDDGRDCVRWSRSDERLLLSMEKEIPFELRVVLRQAVQRYGKDTASLLNHVYRTPPMLAAAPGDRLDFKLAVKVRSSGIPPLQVSTEISNKEAKRLRSALREVRDSRDAPLYSEQLVCQHKPRYDDVFSAGLAWLDSIAGEPLRQAEWVAEFDDSVWRSPTRNADQIP